MDRRNSPVVVYLPEPARRLEDYLVVSHRCRGEVVELLSTIVDRPHLGWGRHVPPDALFHETVKLREQDAKLKYKPRAHYEKATVKYVN